MKDIFAEAEEGTRLYNIINQYGSRIQDVQKMKEGATIKLGNFTFALYNLQNVYASHYDECQKLKEKHGDDSNYCLCGQNPNSIVSKATVNGKTIYFSGDIQNDLEFTNTATQVEDYARKIGKVDLYKAAHHSSKYYCDKNGKATRTNGEKYGNNNYNALSYLLKDNTISIVTHKNVGFLEGRNYVSFIYK